MKVRKGVMDDEKGRVRKSGGWRASEREKKDRKRMKGKGARKGERKRARRQTHMHIFA